MLSAVGPAATAGATALHIPCYQPLVKRGQLLFYTLLPSSFENHTQLAHFQPIRKIVSETLLRQVPQAHLLSAVDASRWIQVGDRRLQKPGRQAGPWYTCWRLNSLQENQSACLMSSLKKRMYFISEKTSDAMCSNPLFYMQGPWQSGE